MKTILEKLLPERFWKKPVPLDDEQFWKALNSPVNPQTHAVLHIAQDKFMEHALSAADPTAEDGKRLRAWDRAMAIATFLEEVDASLKGAKKEVERRDAMHQKEAA